MFSRPIVTDKFFFSLVFSFRISTPADPSCFEIFPNFFRALASVFGASEIFPNFFRALASVLPISFFLASSSPLSALANRSGVSKYSRVPSAFSRRCYRVLSRVLSPATDANESLALSGYPRRPSMFSCKCYRLNTLAIAGYIIINYQYQLRNIIFFANVLLLPRYRRTLSWGWTSFRLPAWLSTFTGKPGATAMIPTPPFHFSHLKQRAAQLYVADYEPPTIPRPNGWNGSKLPNCHRNLINRVLPR